MPRWGDVWVNSVLGRVIVSLYKDSIRCVYALYYIHCTYIKNDKKFYFLLNTNILRVPSLAHYQ